MKRILTCLGLASLMALAMSPAEAGYTTTNTTYYRPYYAPIAIATPIAYAMPTVMPTAMPIAATATPASHNTRAVQERLAELGYFKGKQDGKMGPKTHRALIRFQRDNNLAKDGTVNTETSAALFGSGYSFVYQFGRPVAYYPNPWATKPQYTRHFNYAQPIAGTVPFYAHY
jgi:hypothetical protein